MTFLSKCKNSCSEYDIIKTKTPHQVHPLHHDTAPAHYSDALNISWGENDPNQTNKVSEIDVYSRDYVKNADFWRGNGTGGIFSVATQSAFFAYS